MFLTKKKRLFPETGIGAAKRSVLKKTGMKKGHNYALQIPEKIFNQDSKTKKKKNLENDLYIKFFCKLFIPVPDGHFRNTSSACKFFF